MIRPMARGAALITALILVAVLFIISVAFLSFIQQDYAFAHRQERAARAYYLAVSGLEYYSSHTEAFEVGVPKRLAVLPADPTQAFELTVAADGTLTSQGLLLSGLGEVLAERILVAPQGDLARLYDRSR